MHIYNDVHIPATYIYMLVQNIETGSQRSFLKWIQTISMHNIAGKKLHWKIPLKFGFQDLHGTNCEANYPLKFFGKVDTDRSYKSFARFRSVVIYPHDFALMTFYEWPVGLVMTNFQVVVLLSNWIHPQIYHFNGWYKHSISHQNRGGFGCDFLEWAQRIPKCLATCRGVNQSSNRNSLAAPL